MADVDQSTGLPPLSSYDDIAERVENTSSSDEDIHMAIQLRPGAEGVRVIATFPHHTSNPPDTRALSNYDQPKEDKEDFA